EQCLEELETYIAKEKILLISPIYLGEEVWKEEKDPEFDRDSVIKCRKLKEIYESIAKERGIHFMAASNYVEADKADDEHLNENGHQILANVVYDKLIEIKML
nr:arylesterase [Lachnospiraceae bacterium]